MRMLAANVHTYMNATPSAKFSGITRSNFGNENEVEVPKVTISLQTTSEKAKNKSEAKARAYQELANSAEVKAYLQSIKMYDSYTLRVVENFNKETGIYTYTGFVYEGSVFKDSRNGKSDLWESCRLQARRE